MRGSRLATIASASSALASTMSVCSSSASQRATAISAAARDGRRLGSNVTSVPARRAAVTAASVASAAPAPSTGVMPVT